MGDSVELQDAFLVCVDPENPKVIALVFAKSVSARNGTCKLDVGFVVDLNTKTGFVIGYSDAVAASKGRKDKSVFFNNIAIECASDGCIGFREKNRDDVLMYVPEVEDLPKVCQRYLTQLG